MHQVDGSSIYQLMGIEIHHHKDRSPYLHHGEVQQSARQPGQKTSKERRVCERFRFCRGASSLSMRIQQSTKSCGFKTIKKKGIRPGKHLNANICNRQIGAGKEANMQRTAFYLSCSKRCKRHGQPGSLRCFAEDPPRLCRDTRHTERAYL